MSLEEYIKASEALFEQLFGPTKLKALQKVKAKEIDWKGPDVSCSNILAFTPGIKERFGPDWAEYYNERGIGAFELFLQACFHFGFQQGYESAQQEHERPAGFIEMFLKGLDAEERERLQRG